MEVSIKLDVEDWKRFQSHLAKELPKTVKSWANSFWFNVILWAVIAFIFMALFQNQSEFHWPTAGYVSVFFVLLISVFFFNLYKIKMAYAPSENGVFVGTHRFIFNEEGIKSLSNGYEGTHSWSCVRRIERTNGMILIYLDTAFAYVFPESKLENPDRFFDYVNELYEKI